MRIISLLFLLLSNNFSYAENITASYINNLEQQKTNLQNELNTIKNTIQGYYIQKEILLWSGNKYIDGSSTYTLWNSSKHQAWDSIRLYVSYDNGSTTEMHEIDLTGYSYNSTALAQSTLIFKYNTVYIRINIRTTGIDVYGGSGSYWYLKKVVGIKKVLL